MSSQEAHDARTTQARQHQGRVQQHRRYLMCRPEYFAVEYDINPWMDASRPVDLPKAIEQWEALYDTYLSLGHEVELIEPIPGLNDMVYTANGGFVVDGVAIGANFSVSQRRGEEAPFQQWFADHGFEVVRPHTIQEGEGDFALVGDVILAAYGIRTQLDSHVEVAEVFDREVVSLQLVNPAYYHLDTALCVLDPAPGFDPEGRVTVAYLPSAFDPRSQSELRERFPDAIRIPAPTPAALELNAVSDGRNVVYSPPATFFAAQLRERGYQPIPVDLSELQLGGGGIKCCTLELRGGRP